MTKPDDKTIKPTEKVEFTPFEDADLSERTFELEGVHVQLDPVTRRTLKKAAKRLEPVED